MEAVPRPPTEMITIYIIHNRTAMCLPVRFRFGKRKSASAVLPNTGKPRTQQYAADQQGVFNNMYNREDGGGGGGGDSYKSPFKPAVIRNSKDLYDILFPSRRDNDINNRHQYYAMQQDPSNVDMAMDPN